MILYLYFSLKNCFLQFDPVGWKLLSFLNDSKYSLILIYVLYCFYSSKYTYITYIIIIYLYSGYYDYIYIYEYMHSFKKLNKTLLNGLLLIHPMLLYLTYVGLYKIVFIKTISKQLTFFEIKKESKIIVGSSMLALILGAWWAQQELNWGGWWNWDPIEMIAFIIFYVSLLLLHNNFTSNTTIKTNFSKVKIIFLLIYVITRFDILNSIHSFAVSNNSDLIFELKILILYIFFFLIGKTAYNYKIKNQFYLISFWFLYFCFNLIVLFSITNISLYEINIRNSYILISILLLNNFVKNNKIVFLFLNLFSIFCIDYYVIITIFICAVFYKKYVLFRNIHTIFITIVIFMYLYSEMNFFTLKVPKQTYSYITCNYSWVYVNDFINYLYKFNKNFLRENQPINVFNLHYSNFFFQNIYTNLSFSVNFINNINIIYFLEKFLFFYIIAFVIIFYNICTFYKNNQLKSGIV